MLVLVGAVVAGAVVVGAVVSVVVGAGATGSVVVALPEDGVVVAGVVAVVVTAGVVDEVAGEVEPPPFVSSTIPKITSAIRIAATTPKPTKTAGLRCHGVDPGSGCCCP
jgi:hypothetical protein